MLMTLEMGKTKMGINAVTAMGIVSDIHHHSITNTVASTTRSFHVNQFGKPMAMAHARKTGRTKLIFRMDEINTTTAS
jgi:hypothetical protein